MGSHNSSVDTIMVETWLHVCTSGILTRSWQVGCISHDIAAFRRYSQRLCAVWYCLAPPQGCEQLQTPFCEPRRNPCHWNAHQHCPHHQRPKRIPLDKKYSSQVSVPCHHGATSVTIFIVFSSVIIGSLGGPLSFSPVSGVYRHKNFRC
jgi:hypothetical protein